VIRLTFIRVLGEERLLKALNVYKALNIALSLLFTPIYEHPVATNPVATNSVATKSDMPSPLPRKEVA
jgi:hypothetical protein